MINTDGIKTDIDLQRATQAHNWISFSPEKRAARMIEQYVDTLEQVAAEITRQANGEKETAYAQELFDRMRNRYKNLFNDWINAKSNCASSAITGGSGFNERKAHTANDREHNKAGEVYEFENTFKKYIKKSLAKVYTAQEAQSSDIEKTKRKIAACKKNQEDMKAGNKFYRAWLKNPDAKAPEGLSPELIENIKTFAPKYSFDRQPFASYSMSNNLANIKRMEKRLVELEAKAQAAQDHGTKEQEFNGLTIVKNFEEDRLQLLFDEKPPEDVRAVLKSNGFRYAPSKSAWQRKLTNNALSSLKHRVLNTEPMQQYA